MINIIDLGAIDRLVKRNSNLLTAFKVIDDVDGDAVVNNIQANIRQVAANKVIVGNNILDIVSDDDSIPISYYFAHRYSNNDLAEIFAKIKEFCKKEKGLFLSDIIYEFLWRC